MKKKRVNVILIRIMALQNIVCYHTYCFIYIYIYMLYYRIQSWTSLLIWSGDHYERRYLL